jgi:hypothetical protein
MILDTTSKRIRVYLEAPVTTNELPWYAAYADLDDDEPSFYGLSEDGLTNGVTPVEMIAAPAGTVQRQTKYLEVFNADTVTAVVWIEFFDGVQTPLFRAELLPNERVTFVHEVGWQIFTAEGGTKPGIVSPLTTKGDIWGYDTVDNRIPVGADGEILVANSAQALGVEWTSTIPPLAFNVKTLTVLDDPYTILDTDQILLGDASGGAITATLPAAAGYTGRVFRLKKLDSSLNAVTLDGNGAETIDGAATIVLSRQHETVTVTSDGTEWWII